MAIIQMGQLVAGIRGTVGGVTYSANASGPYAKLWARGPRPTSTAASNERRRLSTWGPRWLAMNPLLRSGWDTYAALPAQAKTNSLGQTYYASGFNWFVEINTARELCGLAYTTSTPSNPAPAAPVGFTFYLRAYPAANSAYYTALANWTGTNYLLAYLWVSNHTAQLAVPLARYVFVRGLLGSVAGPNYAFSMAAYPTDKLGQLTQGLRAFHLLYTMEPGGRCSAPAFYVGNVMAAA